MTKSGVADMEKMVSIDEDVEAKRVAEELEEIEDSIKFEAEASVEEADREGDEKASVEAAETAAKAAELRQATEQSFGL